MRGLCLTGQKYWNWSPNERSTSINVFVDVPNGWFANLLVPYVLDTQVCAGIYDFSSCFYCCVSRAFVFYLYLYITYIHTISCANVSIYVCLCVVFCV